MVNCATLTGQTQTPSSQATLTLPPLYYGDITVTHSTAADGSVWCRQVAVNFWRGSRRSDYWPDARNSLPQDLPAGVIFGARRASGPHLNVHERGIFHRMRVQFESPHKQESGGDFDVRLQNCALRLQTTRHARDSIEMGSHLEKIWQIGSRDMPLEQDLKQSCSCPVVPVSHRLVRAQRIQSSANRHISFSL